MLEGLDFMIYSGVVKDLIVLIFVALAEVGSLLISVAHWWDFMGMVFRW